MVIKECLKCHETRPLSEFYRESGTRDGHRSDCKRCVRRYQRARYAINPEASRLYQAMMNEKNRANGYSYQRSPEKTAAKQAVASAKRGGRLLSQPCKVCGAGRSEAHHPDYQKPLEVIWLCRKHHKELHRMEQPEWARAIA